MKNPLHLLKPTFTLCKDNRGYFRLWLFTSERNLIIARDSHGLPLMDVMGRAPLKVFWENYPDLVAFVSGREKDSRLIIYDIFMRPKFRGKVANTLNLIISYLEEQYPNREIGEYIPKARLMGVPDFRPLKKNPQYPINQKMINRFEREASAPLKLIGWLEIPCSDFLRLTTTDDLQVSRILLASKDSIDKEEADYQDQPPFLIIDPAGLIRGHEGRHRTSAAFKSGEKFQTIALLAHESSWKKVLPSGRDYWYSPIPIENLPTLTGEFDQDQTMDLAGLSFKRRMKDDWQTWPVSLKKNPYKTSLTYYPDCISQSKDSFDVFENPTRDDIRSIFKHWLSFIQSDNSARNHFLKHKTIELKALVDITSANSYIWNSWFASHADLIAELKLKNFLDVFIIMDDKFNILATYAADEDYKLDMEEDTPENQPLFRKLREAAARSSIMSLILEHLGLR